VPLLIVGDGKALTMIDYQVKQVSRWPIGNSPLSVLLNPNQDISRIAKVTEDTPQVLLVPRATQAARIRNDHHGLCQGCKRSVGADAQGWTTVDAQNNRSTIKLSTSGSTFQLPKAPSASWIPAAPGRAQKLTSFIGPTG
jgi:outer membrane lipoprotein-sorting protein